MVDLLAADAIKLDIETLTSEIASLAHKRDILVQALKVIEGDELLSSPKVIPVPTVVEEREPPKSPCTCDPDADGTIDIFCPVHGTPRERQEVALPVTPTGVKPPLSVAAIAQVMSDLDYPVSAPMLADLTGYDPVTTRKWLRQGESEGLIVQTRVRSQPRTQFFRLADHVATEPPPETGGIVPGEALKLCAMQW